MVYNKNHIDEYNSTHEVSLYDLIKYPSDDKIYPSETIPMSWEQNEMFCHYLSKFDDNGNLLEEFNTMTDCVKAGYKNAKLVAQGKREHCKGFVFKYLD